MKNIFFFILLFGTVASKAQIITNIYWTQESNMPKSEVIYYKNSQKLQWSDFAGVPILTGNVAAITMSGFGYNASMKRNGDQGEINISVYCYFSKPKSWVKPDKKTAYILNHEQIHFDISYIAASLFIAKLKNSNITTKNINTVIPPIYQEYCDLMNKMQDDYDGQTKNGQVKELQEKWNNEINKKLSVIAK